MAEPDSIQPSRFVDRVAVAWPPEAWQDVSVLVAVSGGADSVALLRALASLKTAGEGRLVVGHFNHQLRGADSDADEAFVADLCCGLGLRWQVGHASDCPVEWAKARDGLESAARMIRYEFLRQAAEEVGARFVVLAHTADDQVETILHRIVRGTGLAGLAGMQRCRPLGPAATVIRPLLGLWRADVVAYLTDCGQSFREDLSNCQTRYTRNRIRHELLPTLRRDFNPQVSEAILRIGMLAGEVQSVVDHLVDSLARPNAVRFLAGQLEFDGNLLASEPRYLVRELLVRQWRARGWSEQNMGWAEWEWLVGVLVDGESAGVRILPGAVRAEFGHRRLVLSAAAESGE